LLKQDSIDEMLTQSFISKDMSIRRDFENLFELFSDEVKEYYASKLSIEKTHFF